MQLPAILTMAHLKKAGALQPDAPLFVGIDIGVRLRIYPREDHFLIQVPKSDNVNLSKYFNSLAEDNFDLHVVRYVYRERKFGRRPFFICPVIGRDCIKLIVNHGVLASPAGYRKHRTAHGPSAISYARIRAKLLKLDGARRLDGTSRAELVQRIRSHPHLAAGDPEMLAFLEQEDRREQRKAAKWGWEQRLLSTTKGLDLGRDAGQDAVIEEEYLERHRSYWAENIAPVSVPETRPPPMNIEAVPELDICVLLERDWLRTEEFRARSLGWPREATNGLDIVLIADRRDPNEPLLLAKSWSEDWRDGTWQKIDLLYGSRSARPRYFRCPVTGKRCEKLYFRRSIFASRGAHNLFYPSQRAHRDLSG